MGEKTYVLNHVDSYNHRSYICSLQPQFNTIRRAKLSEPWINTFNELETPWKRKTTPRFAAFACVASASLASWLWVKHASRGNVWTYVA